MPENCCARCLARIVSLLRARARASARVALRPHRHLLRLQDLGPNDIRTDVVSAKTRPFVSRCRASPHDVPAGCAGLRPGESAEGERDDGGVVAHPNGGGDFCEDGELSDLRDGSEAC